MIKFSYEPFKNKFISFIGTDHAQQIKSVKEFDQYIRGIIVKDTLYLRTYYPFNNIQDLNLKELNIKSKLLLKDNLNNIKRMLKKHNITYNAVVFNATNDLIGQKYI